MTRATHFAVETPRGHYLPVVGQRRRDCALSIACQMAHELAHGLLVPASCPPRCGWSQPLEALNVEDYVYNIGAGPLAHIEQPRSGGPHDRGGAAVGQPPRQTRAGR